MQNTGSNDVTYVFSTTGSLDLPYSATLSGTATTNTNSGSTVTVFSSGSIFGKKYKNQFRNYEPILIIGRKNQNSDFVMTGGFDVSTRTSVGSSSVFSLPIRNKIENIFVLKFSSPGDPQSSSDSYLDIESGEYSPYTALPYRNLQQREIISELSTNHADGPYDGILGNNTASFHKVNKNPRYAIVQNGNTVITGSINSNNHVLSAIPYYNESVNWIKSLFPKLSGSVDSFVHWLFTTGSSIISGSYNIPFFSCSNSKIDLTGSWFNWIHEANGQSASYFLEKHYNKSHITNINKLQKDREDNLYYVLNKNKFNDIFGNKDKNSYSSFIEPTIDSTNLSISSKFIDSNNNKRQINISVSTLGFANIALNKAYNVRSNINEQINKSLMLFKDINANNIALNQTCFPNNRTLSLDKTRTRPGWSFPYWNSNPDIRKKDSGTFVSEYFEERFTEDYPIGLTYRYATGSSWHLDLSGYYISAINYSQSNFDSIKRFGELRWTFPNVYPVSLLIGSPQYESSTFPAPPFFDSDDEFVQNIKTKYIDYSQIPEFSLNNIITSSNLPLKNSYISDVFYYKPEPVGKSLSHDCALEVSSSITFSGNDRTISFWAKNTEAVYDHALAEFDGLMWLYFEPWPYYSSDPNGITLSLTADGLSASIGETISNSWVYNTITINNGNLLYYINGTLIGTQQTSTFSSAHGDKFILMSNDLSQFNIANIAYFDYALTSEEIASLSSAGVGFNLKNKYNSIWTGTIPSIYWHTSDLTGTIQNSGYGGPAKLTVSGNLDISSHRLSTQFADLYNPFAIGWSNALKNVDLFQITGSTLSSSLTTFNLHSIENKEPKYIKFKFNMVNKLRPYKNFYPVQKTLEIASVFSSSLEYSGSVWPLYTHFAAPGLLYNSIRSGLPLQFPKIFDSLPSVSSDNEGYWLSGALDFENLYDIHSKMYQIRLGSYYDSSAYSVYTGTQDDNRYRSIIKNFIKESNVFFMKNEDLSYFESAKESEFKIMSKSLTYSMELKINDLYNFNVISPDSPVEKYYKQSSGLSTINSFGPFGRKSSTYTGSYTVSYVNCPYLPPYLKRMNYPTDGHNITVTSKTFPRLKIDFVPSETRQYSIAEIFSSATFSYEEDVVYDVCSGVIPMVDVPSFGIESNYQTLDKIFNIFSIKQDVHKSVANYTWNISGKAEFPYLDYTHITSYHTGVFNNIKLSETGMWLQYGEIPSENKGLRLNLIEITGNHRWRNTYGTSSFYDTTNYGSLLDVCGFDKSKKSVNLCRLKDSKIIKELICLIPFDQKSNSFYEIDENSELAIKNKEYLREYIVPPHLDNVYGLSNKSYFMIFAESTSELDREDLSRIWQNCMPKISIDHEFYQKSITLSSDDYPIIKDIIKDNCDWLVFKSKQRANNNKVQFENYGYNWPYDNFSLIELLKIESEIGYD